MRTLPFCVGIVRWLDLTYAVAVGEEGLDTRAGPYLIACLFQPFAIFIFSKNEPERLVSNRRFFRCQQLVDECFHSFIIWIDLLDWQRMSILFPIPPLSQRGGYFGCSLPIGQIVFFTNESCRVYQQFIYPCVFASCRKCDMISPTSVGMLLVYTFTPPRCKRGGINNEASEWSSCLKVSARAESC